MSFVRNVRAFVRNVRGVERYLNTTFVRNVPYAREIQWLIFPPLYLGDTFGSRAHARDIADKTLEGGAQ